MKSRLAISLFLIAGTLHAQTVTFMVKKPSSKEKDAVQMVEPILPTQFGVVQVKGEKVVEGQALQCKTSMESRKIVIEGEEANLIVTKLYCKHGVELEIRGVSFALDSR